MDHLNKTSTPKTRCLAWQSLPDDVLLNYRLCDLGLQIEGTVIQPRIDRLYDELRHQGIRFRPHCWLGEEWFSPDGVPGIAVPFYLAHPRLMRLERKMMLEVEGGTEQSCMRILRHEAGHAIDTAFQLHKRKSYRQVFGNYHAPYPEYYRPRPQSKRYVLHLEPWYAQSHPAEDFAESFAVWLTPNSRWQTRYAGWPALKKIEYIDRVLARRPKVKVKSRAKVEPAHRITRTLREHYEQRHAYYSIDCPTGFDRDLQRLFSEAQHTGRRKTAAQFLEKHRAEIGNVVASATGEYRYNVNQVLREMINRCRSLKLRVAGDETQLLKRVIAVVTVHTMNYLHGGLHRIAL